jgi:hypothetical protein
MRNVFITGICPLLFCLLGGCASVKIYSNSELTTETGLKFYSVKPYLLVEMNQDKETVSKTTIIYLPDVQNPQYLVLKPGFGSNELKLSFTNGSLSSYGVLSESQVTETINALATLASKSGYAVNAFTRTDPVTQATSGNPGFRLYEIVIGTTGTSLKEVK